MARKPLPSAAPMDRVTLPSPARRPRRLLLAALLAIALGVSMSGCALLKSNTSSQLNTIGPVKITSVICAGDTNSNNTGYSPADSSCQGSTKGGNFPGDAANGTYQISLAYRISNLAGGTEQLHQHRNVQSSDHPLRQRCDLQPEHRPRQRDPGPLSGRLGQEVGRLLLDHPDLQHLRVPVPHRLPDLRPRSNLRCGAVPGPLRLPGDRRLAPGRRRHSGQHLVARGHLRKLDHLELHRRRRRPRFGHHPRHARDLRRRPVGRHHLRAPISPRPHATSA